MGEVALGEGRKTVDRQLVGKYGADKGRKALDSAREELNNRSGGKGTTTSKTTGFSGTGQTVSQGQSQGKVKKHRKSQATKTIHRQEPKRRQANQHLIHPSKPLAGINPEKFREAERKALTNAARHQSVDNGSII